MLGSAIAAASGIGAVADLAAGARDLVRIDERIEPDPERREAYDRLYATYVELYPALRPAIHRLAALDPGAPGEPVGEGARGVTETDGSTRSATSDRAAGRAGGCARRWRPIRACRSRRWSARRRADVAIVGGGYTGLWTAFFLTELDPAARVVLLEQGICGGGPSGRNGGFVTAWWDELPALVADFGVGARPGDGPGDGRGRVDGVGAWCETHGVDAWYRKAGYVWSRARPPPRTGRSRRRSRRAPGSGSGRSTSALSPTEVQARCASPILRGGVFLRGGATVQPALLARGLRRVLLERGVVIHEGTRVVEIDGRREGLGWPLGPVASRGAGPRPVVLVVPGGRRSPVPSSCGRTPAACPARSGPTRSSWA